MYIGEGELGFTENPEPKRRSWKVVEDAAMQLVEDGCAKVPLERLQQVVQKVKRDGTMVEITFQEGEIWLFGPRPLEEEFKVHEEW